MTIAKTVVGCLERYRVPYEIISHPRSTTSNETAKAASVMPCQIAKPVVLGDELGYLMAVVPGDAQVDIAEISRRLGRRLRLVDKSTLAHLFTDCELGAIPPLGPAYGVDTIVDDHVLEEAHVCFVAGDHDELVRVDGEAFRLLIQGARHATIGCATPTGVEPIKQI